MNKLLITNAARWHLNIHSALVCPGLKNAQYERFKVSHAFILRSTICFFSYMSYIRYGCKHLTCSSCMGVGMWSLPRWVPICSWLFSGKRSWSKQPITLTWEPKYVTYIMDASSSGPTNEKPEVLNPRLRLCAACGLFSYVDSNTDDHLLYAGIT